MTNPNVNISITTNQTNKRHGKKRTFSTGYKKYICMRIRKGEERVSAVAHEENLSDAHVYKWLHIYDTTGFEEVCSVDTPVVVVNAPQPEPQEDKSFKLIQALVAQVQKLTDDFSQLKTNLASLAN